MADVLICYYSDCESIYQSIAKQLREMGNNVYLLNVFGRIDFDKWGENYTLRKKYLHLIDDVNPDLVIDFNHAMPPELEARITCPICLWDADAPRHWWNKKSIRDNINRYHFLGFKSCDRELYEDFFKAKIKKFLRLPVGTVIQAQPKKVEHNIAFIGSTFLDLKGRFSGILDKLGAHLPLFQEMFRSIEKDYFIEPDALYQELKKKPAFQDISRNLFDSIFYDLHWCIMPGCDRLRSLSMISDLGLTIYGNTWSFMMAIYPDVAACYDPRRVITIRENQDVYNASKIAVNLSHLQAKDYFSWRVPDIMASNACLLTEYKKDFNELFSPYLSPDVMDAIVFKDRFELRQKAIALLNDEKLRLKCVQECQNAIEKCGRWEDKIRQISEFSGVKLDNAHQSGGRIRLVFPFVKPKEIIPEKKLKKSAVKRKLFFYSLLLFLSYVSGIGKCFKDKHRRKYVSKIIRNQESLNG